MFFTHCTSLSLSAALIKKMDVKDMAIEVKMNGADQDYHWKSTIFCKTLDYPIRKYTYEVSSKSFHQYPQKTFSKKCFRFGQEKNHRRNTVTDVDTLRRKLRHEGAFWRQSDQHVIWRSFPELSFGISWGLNTLSRYRDRATDTSPKIMGIAILKQEDYQLSW